MHKTGYRIPGSWNLWAHDSPTSHWCSQKVTLLNQSSPTFGYRVCQSQHSVKPTFPSRKLLGCPNQDCSLSCLVLLWGFGPFPHQILQCLCSLPTLLNIDCYGLIWFSICKMKAIPNLLPSKGWKQHIVIVQVSSKVLFLIYLRSTTSLTTLWTIFRTVVNNCSKKSFFYHPSLLTRQNTCSSYTSNSLLQLTTLWAILHSQLTKLQSSKAMDLHAGFCFKLNLFPISVSGYFIFSFFTQVTKTSQRPPPDHSSIHITTW